MPLPAPVHAYQRRQAREAASPPAASPEEPLLPWQFAFAEWLANQDHRQPVAEQVAKAEELAQRSVSAASLRALRRRKQFREFYERLRKDALSKARAMLERRYPKFVQAHEDGLDAALDAGDYRAVPSFTVPVLDRVAPKRDIAQANAVVTIHLTEKQQALLATVEDGEFEVLDAEPLDGEPTEG